MHHCFALVVSDCLSRCRTVPRPLTSTIVLALRESLSALLPIEYWFLALTRLIQDYYSSDPDSFMIDGSVRSINVLSWVITNGLLLLVACL